MKKPSSNFDPHAYWEERARQFAGSCSGWKAVCLRGAPDIYNRLIHRLQKKALFRAARLTPTATCLEFGCGVGRWEEALSGRVKTICGVDISSEMLSKAKEQLGAAGTKNVHICRFDGSRLPYHTDSFNILFSVTVLIHIIDPDNLSAAIGEMCRVTASDGQILVLEGFQPSSEESPPHVRYRSEEYIADRFKKNGWRLRYSIPVYCSIPAENSLGRRTGRIRFRMTAPFYYLFNSLNQSLHFSRRGPMQNLLEFYHD